MSIDVSVIIPVYNGESWLEECLQSVYHQTFAGLLELSIYNDSSTDNTASIIEEWQHKLTGKGIKVTVGTGSSDASPKGVGYAKNRAVDSSCGKYLCFLDADDVMSPNRVEAQYNMARSLSDPTVIGSQFKRLPVDSTERFTAWANELTPSQLYTQAYTSHGPTVIMPTWFMSRETFDRVGEFDESGKGTPEDLIFFYKHISLGGKLVRVDECLLTYRYHAAAATFSVKEETIWDLRIKFIEETVLKKWSSFTIWNAGKQGRQFYRNLQEVSRDKVVAFCDVDAKKIAQKVYTYQDSPKRPKPTVPIIHFSEAKAPIIICMKLGLTGGGFEANLDSLGLKEGEDYYHFN